MYNHRRNIRGEGRMGSIIGFAIFVAVVYILIKIIPLFVADYTFEERIKEEALTAVSQHGVEEEVLRERILKHAKAENIPVRSEDIHISLERKTLEIAVKYTVVVEFPGYTWRYTENPKYTATKYN